MQTSPSSSTSSIISDILKQLQHPPISSNVVKHSYRWSPNSILHMFLQIPIHKSWIGAQNSKYTVELPKCTWAHKWSKSMKAETSKEVADSNPLVVRPMTYVSKYRKMPPCTLWLQSLRKQHFMYMIEYRMRYCLTTNFLLLQSKTTSCWQDTIVQ